MSAFQHLISLLGVISMISLLVAAILLIRLIQQAFDRAGVIWGVIATIYPPGTYYYCRKNWDTMRDKFVIITGLILVALILWAVVKIV